MSELALRALRALTLPARQRANDFGSSMNETASIQPPLTPPRLAAFRAADGYRLWARVWDAPAPVARVVCLHGIISHSGWYLRSCQYLAQQGFEVHFLDRRGSGLNCEDRGDVAGFETWLDDVENYLDALGGRLPRLLVGISWGGKLGVAIAKDRPWLLDGLALVCPGVVAQTKARPWQRAALRLTGATRLRRRHVPIPLQDPAMFADDPDWQAYIRDDPFTLRRVTIRAALADLHLNRYVADAAPQIRVPTLLMLAGRDRIIDNPGMWAFMGQLGTHQKKLIEYPQAAHTLEFESPPDPFFNDLATWLRQTAESPNFNPSAGIILAESWGAES